MFVLFQTPETGAMFTRLHTRARSLGPEALLAPVQKRGGTFLESEKCVQRSFNPSTIHR